MAQQYLYILDIKTGKILVEDLLGTGNTMDVIQGFFYNGQKIFLSGKLMYATSSDIWYTKIWTLDESNQIVETSLKKGLIIGDATCDVVGLYQCCSEKQGCNKFSVNTLGRGKTR
jgi:hypothetical protein